MDCVLSLSEVGVSMIMLDNELSNLVKRRNRISARISEAEDELDTVEAQMTEIIIAINRIKELL